MLNDHQIILLFTTLYLSILLLLMRKSYNYEISLLYIHMVLGNSLDPDSGVCTVFGLSFFLAGSGSGFNEYGSKTLSYRNSGPHSRDGKRPTISRR